MTEFGKSVEPRYAVLIGDVVDSRRIEHRSEFQRRLEATLRATNERLGPEALAAPIVLTAGDEIQGLFRDPSACIAAVTALAEELFPVTLLYGLGFGALATDLRPNPAMMDGPCFHRARRALDRARKADAWLCARGFGEPHDEVISAMMRLLGTIRSRWTETQNRYASAYRAASRQKDVAARFDVSPSVVSESLKAAAFEAVVAGERAVERLLAGFAPPRAQ